ncbi:MAG: CopG family transcriptional regulator [Actinomycetota bacterium]
MRTTLNVDEDVLLAVKERARREKRSTGQILSDLARQALTGQSGVETVRSAGAFGFSPLPHRGATVSNLLIDRLREEDPA